MMSLFNSFDYKFFNPFMLLMVFLAWTYSNIVYKSSYKVKILSMYSENSIKFFLTLKPKKFSKFMSIMFLTIMSLLMMFNFPAVTSYNFALTSQISIVLFLSLSLWLSMVVFHISKSIKSLLTHCIPEGTPMPLVWFLFMIEIVSSLIRPITLSVRLVANILAGHLLMILLSKLALNFKMVVLAYFCLNMIEFMVSMIQAYIYSTMMTLYYAEIE